MSNKILQLTQMTQDLKQKIIEAVESSPYRDYIQSISLFGSYLRGDQKPDSDLDLLIQLKKMSAILLFLPSKGILKKDLVGR